MRLIDLFTGEFAEFNDPYTKLPYAILSHRWDRQEQSYQDIRGIQNRYRRARESFSTPGPPHPPSSSSRSQYHVASKIPPPSSSMSIWDSDSGLSDKVRGACKTARRDGFRYLWIDSCCIDKTSSSELSESINSMFAWYRDAAVCYAFLSDVPTLPAASLRSRGSPFRLSVWFTRAWTLQELIAPATVVFFSQTWKILGTKASLAGLVEEITNIPVSVLTGYGGGSQQSLDECSVAQRMSWTGRRQATQVEDEAYSLLGIFDIQMPTLYGEGKRAFRRLQEEILRRIPDQTIFAWGPVCPNTFPELVTPSHPDNKLNEINIIQDVPTNELCPHYMLDATGIDCSIFANSPRDFAGAGNVVSVPHDHFIGLLTRYCPISPQEYTSTPHGIRTSLPLLPLEACLSPYSEVKDDAQRVRWYLAVLACEQSHRSESGQLLARICHVAAPERPVNLLRGGLLRINMPASAEGTGAQVKWWLSPCGIVRLAVDPRDECQWLVQLRVHTVFLDHPSRAPPPSRTIPPNESFQEKVGDSDLDYQTVVFTLPTWCQGVLSARGYAASLEEPRGGGGRGVYRLVLARGPALQLAPNESESDPCRWWIVADFSCEWITGPVFYNGLNILAAVRVLYISDGNRLPVKKVGDTKELVWPHELSEWPSPRTWHCSLMSRRLEFNLAMGDSDRDDSDRDDDDSDRDDSDTITMELGVQLVSEFCYQIHVDIISDSTR